jgi:hypothetical protein
MELTEDDIAILLCVYRHRFVRADELYRLINRSPDRLSRRLTLLFRNEYLDRPIAQVDRYRGGGSRPLVYGLGAAGARYLKERLGTPIGKTDWRSRNRTYTRENLDHTLAVSKVLIDLELACCARSDVSFIPFDDILAVAPVTTRQAKNPMSWPVPMHWHGGRAEVYLIPDAIFGLRLQRPDGSFARSYFFVEIDRGTMTIVPGEGVRQSDAFPHRATILRKLHAYAESYRLNLHERYFGMKAPRTLFLTTTVARGSAMRAAFATHVEKQLSIPTGLMLFDTLERDLLDMLLIREHPGPGL